MKERVMIDHSRGNIHQYLQIQNLHNGEIVILLEHLSDERCVMRCDASLRSEQDRK